MTRVLTLSHVYPRADAPAFGIFVHRRALHLARHVELEAVAPIPWFPAGERFGRPRRRDVPRRGRLDDIPVEYPSFVSVPGIAKSLDPALYALALLPQLRRLRRRFAFDVLDAHFGYPDGVAAACLGALLGCPVVITYRGCEEDFVLSPARRVQMSWAARRSRIICVSESLARVAGAIAAPRIRVIPNGVDAERFTPGDRAASRRRLGLPQDWSIVLVPAAFVPVKRHDIVLRSVAALRGARPGKLLYVGVGGRGGTSSCVESVQALAAQLGLSDCARFAVDRAPEEMVDWYRAADVVALASAREGSPNAVREALACGVPVVASAVGDIATVVRQRRDGIVVDVPSPEAFTAALAEGLTTSWDRDAIAAAGGQRTWADVAREVVEELEAAKSDSLGKAV